MEAYEHGRAPALHSDFPITLLAAIQDQLKEAFSLCETTLSRDLSEEWSITAARFLPLYRALADPVVVNGLEENLVAAGLYGGELRLRVALFNEVVRNDRAATTKKLAAAAAILRAIDRVPELAATVAPVADLCDVIVAALGPADDPAT